MTSIKHGLQEAKFFDVRIFYWGAKRLHGMTELPSAFVALYGNRMLVVGEPPKDVLQNALSEAGFTRLEVTRVRAGGGLLDVKGLFIDAYV